MTRKVSLNKRFKIVVISVSTLILIVVVYTQIIVNRTAYHSLQTNHHSQQLEDKIKTIKYSIQEIERNIYQQTILSDKSLKQSLIETSEILKQQIESLNTLWKNVNFVKSHLIKIYPHENNSDILINQLQNGTKILQQQIKEFLKITGSVQKKFPGMKLLTKKLLPLNQEFIGQITIAIEVSKTFQNDQNYQVIRTLLENTRYAWAQQISYARLFVANRLGTFGDPISSMKENRVTRKIYLKIIRDNINKLKTMNADTSLEFQLSDAITNMYETLQLYEHYFIKVQRIYLSDNWRNDIALLQEQLRPSFLILWETINLIENKLKSYIDYNNVITNQTVNLISYFIWIFTSVILILLISGYFTFNQLIRKPIKRVASALNLVAKGKTVIQEIPTHANETKMLVNAFNNMQAQVISRQNRLESILETADEGIITIDEYGIIETFNTAAQKLFGYHSSEIFGKPISMLICSSNHNKFKEFLIEKSAENKLNVRTKDREINATTKNGRVFPLSMKLSKLIADEKKLYTILVEDISERKALLENLQRIADHDSLTGLYNRLYLMNELERITERSKRNNSDSFVLLYIDLDNFKYINDTLGHLAGDQLLIEVTAIFSSKLRNIDLIARLGGDEFAVILYNVSKESALKIANILRIAIQNYVFNKNKKSIQIGCSIGVAPLDNTVLNKEDLLSRADFACKTAKNSGRNKIHSYTHTEKQQRLTLSNEFSWMKKIKDAIKQNRFFITKQPIYDIKNKCIAKYEILLRMLDVNGQIIMPSAFVNQAERFGLTREIDIWVVKHALLDLANYNKNNQHPVSYSINLSANFFENNNLINCIKYEIEKNKIKPSLLTFEITEISAMTELGLTVSFIENLRKIGCKIALDNFGVGYSSFSYLKEIPVDYVKIDGSFIRNITHNDVSFTVVKSMNDISHVMNKKTMADYAEDQKCLTLLTKIGVDYVQGAYIEKLAKQELETELTVS